ncbi:glycogenin-1 isoform X2 [Solea senegalensis]|uniref:glycogenin glucosyltransferase n=1 Tax=Solea senegalensis TaxID=28829 RepID=A0AAV6RD24_SOLSE|nr:glycogenin-2 isoform X2 [Solea senegalensis]KAG7501931.1 glycogenin-1 isoform X2 [Solea senegalensis]
MADEAFVTLATTESYCMGATVVARSLQRHGTTRSIVAMVTPNVSQKSRLDLESVFDEVIVVDMMDSEDRYHLALLERPELGITFTKIHCWTLTHYSKCVFLDADTLVLCNVDELFERDELTAAPDPGWPDCFNSGVFVFKPSLHTHARLLDHALQHGSFDGGDQGLLNSFFSSWPHTDIAKHLPFIYNLSASSIYTYLPAFQHFGHNAKIVHFLGAMKPWSSHSQWEAGHSHTMRRFVSLWWREYDTQQHTTPPAPGKEPPHDSERTQLHTTPPAPLKEPSHDSERTQQVSTQDQEQEARMPFTEELDTSDSLLALSPITEEQRSLVERHREEFSHTGCTPVLEESKSSEREQSEDLKSLGTEDLKDSDTSAADITQQPDREQLERRRLWEAGHADYLGRDSFQNIQMMLDCFLE